MFGQCTYFVVLCKSWGQKQRLAYQDCDNELDIYCGPIWQKTPRKKDAGILDLNLASFYWNLEGDSQKRVGDLIIFMQPYCIRVTFGPIITRQHLLAYLKDNDEPKNKQGAVYKTKCSNCQASYIGPEPQHQTNGTQTSD